jgi:dUTP pyrophosphatase
VLLKTHTVKKRIIKQISITPLQINNMDSTTENLLSNDNRTLKVKRLRQTSRLPTRMSACAAGYDLYADENVCIIPYERKVVKTGIALEFPESTIPNTIVWGHIKARSGMSLSKSVDVGAGVIDNDYRGEIMVLLINNSDNRVYINSGDRIAQLVLELAFVSDVLEVDALNRNSGRDDRGFGSTGK